MGPKRRLLALVVLLAASLSACSGDDAPGAGAATGAPPLVSRRAGPVHTLLLTDCAKYQDWQTVAGAFAWRESRQPGAITRIANCKEEDRARYPKALLEYVDTHFAPEVARNAALDDYYAPYNKPEAVRSWLEANPSLSEEYLLLLDADMLMVKPFDVEARNVSKGWAVAAEYNYMKGVYNDMALRHVPEVPPRTDTLAGPAGRRADVVGAPYLMRADDMRRVVPLWAEYTARVRNDTQAWKDAGDSGAHEGQRVWIAEMYGYAYGAAKAGVWHSGFGKDFTLYPGELPAAMPRSIHYGLLFHIGDKWSFDKHWYLNFDVHKCPPWNLDVTKPQEGLFPPPPHPDTLTAKDYASEYRDLISAEAMALVNAAMCDYHRRNCPASQQLDDVCGKADALYADVKARIKDIEGYWGCVDHHAACEGWAKGGECEKNKQYMRDNCAPSCGMCEPLKHFVPKDQRDAAAAAAAAKPSPPPADAAQGAPAAGEAAGAEAAAAGGAEAAAGGAAAAGAAFAEAAAGAKEAAAGGAAAAGGGGEAPAVGAEAAAGGAEAAPGAAAGEAAADAAVAKPDAAAPAAGGDEAALKDAPATAPAVGAVKAGAAAVRPGSGSSAGDGAPAAAAVGEEGEGAAQAAAGAGGGGELGKTAGVAGREPAPSDEGSKLRKPQPADAGADAAAGDGGAGAGAAAEGGEAEEGAGAEAGAELGGFGAAGEPADGDAAEPADAAEGDAAADDGDADGADAAPDADAAEADAAATAEDAPGADAAAGELLAGTTTTTGERGESDDAGEEEGVDEAEAAAMALAEILAESEAAAAKDAPIEDPDQADEEEDDPENEDPIHVHRHRIERLTSRLERLASARGGEDAEEGVEAVEGVVAAPDALEGPEGEDGEEGEAGAEAADAEAAEPRPAEGVEGAEGAGDAGEAGDAGDGGDAAAAEEGAEGGAGAAAAQDADAGATAPAAAGEADVDAPAPLLPVGVNATARAGTGGALARANGTRPGGAGAPGPGTLGELLDSHAREKAEQQQQEEAGAADARVQLEPGEAASAGGAASASRPSAERFSRLEERCGRLKSAVRLKACLRAALEGWEYPLEGDPAIEPQGSGVGSAAGTLPGADGSGAAGKHATDLSAMFALRHGRGPQAEPDERPPGGGGAAGAEAVVVLTVAVACALVALRQPRWLARLRGLAPRLQQLKAVHRTE